MSEDKETLEKNWYKAVTALKFAKEGLQDFVAYQIDTFHRKVYNKALALLPTCTSCNTCTLQTVLPCPTKGICGKGNNCHFHDRNDPAKQPRACPQNVCASVRDEIIYHHKYGSPSFKNTNPQLWQSSSWETAKCYMAPSGYLDNYTANDTDFTGLISVILNHADFQSAITENLNQPNNVFEQARDVRNSIMHSSNLQISTTDYKHCFSVLTKVLSDPKQIQTLPASAAAAIKLQQLDTDQIHISTEDKERLRKEALDAVQSIQDATQVGTQTITDVAEESTKKIRERTDEGTIRLDQKATSGLDKLKEETTRAVKTLQDETSKTSRKITDVADTAEQQLKTISNATINDIDSKHQQIDKKYLTILSETEKVKQDMTTKMKETEYQTTTEIREMTDQGISRLDQQTMSGLDTLEVATIRAVKTVQDESSKTSRTASKYSYKDLQTHLIQFYKTNGYFKMPVSPLVDDEDVDVETLFAMPLMRIAQHGPTEKKGEKDSDMNVEINSIKDLFQKEGRTIRRVCLSGDAGHGKTTLCQMIISAWCKIQANEECHKVELPQKDIEFLKSFRYLFYLPLRYLNDLSNVTDMIKRHIVRPIFHSLLDQIMREESEKCLIILDGLDEWASSGSLPYIDQREEFSVLMTSRAWKLEVIRPKSSELQQEVQVLGNDQVTLMDKLVIFLNEKYHKLRLTSSFFSSLHRGGGKLTNIPIIMTHLVCMWYDDRDLGKTRVEISCNLVNMLLETADKRINGEETDLTTTPKGGLDCIRNLHFCRKYGSVIQILAKLAFHTLFSEKKEETLVFSQSDNEIHGISQADIEPCLKTGILSQSKFIANVSSKSKRLSFLHKSFQEFFAAIYIAEDAGCDRLRRTLDKFGSVYGVLGISDVLIYVSGLRPDLLNEVSKYIAGLTDNDINHAKLINVFHNTCKSIQDLVFKCSAEAYSTSKQTVHVTLNTVIVDHSNDIPIPEKDLIIENIKSYRDKRYMDTGHSSNILRNICKKNAGSIVTYDVAIGLKDEMHCELIAEMVLKSSASLTCMMIDGKESYMFCIGILLRALLTAHNLTTLKIQHIAVMCNCIGKTHKEDQCLIKLNLSNNIKLRELRFNDMRMYIYPESEIVLPLEYIELSNIVVTHAGLETFRNLIFQQIHLKDICLRDITCSTCKKVTCFTLLNLSGHTKLQRLKMSNVPMSIAVTSDSGLPSESLIMKDIRFTHTWLEKFGLSLCRQIQMRKIVLYNITCTTCRGSCFIPLNLSGNTGLKRLEMRNVSISITSDTELLLRYLTLSDIRCTHEGIEKLSLFLSRQTQMRIVRLDHITCTTCDEGNCSIQLDLSCHTELDTLVMSNVSVYVTSDNEVSLRLPLRSLTLRDILCTHEGIEKLSLFLSRQTQLEWVDLDHITCTTCDEGSCSIQLDLSGHTGLEHLKMRNVSISITSDTELPLRYPTLRDIRCTHEGIEKLSIFLSRQTQMKKVLLDHITCTTCDEGNCSIQLDLSGHTELDTLVMSNVSVYVTSDTELPLTDLTLSDIRCTHEGIEKLSLFLSRQTQMEDVELDHISCTTCDEGSCSIQLDLSGHTGLEHLKMSNLPMSITSDNEVSLRSLTLRDIRCTHEGIEKLSLFLSRQTQMEDVDLDHITCTTCDEGNCSIQLDLSCHTELDTLVMSNVSVYVTSDTELPLTELTLSDIRCTHEGIEKLSLFLSRQTQMEDVELDHISCTTCDEGSCSIQLDLSGHTELEHLKMSNISMSITSDTELLLWSLTLRDIRCTHEGIEKLSIFLSRLIQMRKVRLDHITCTACDEGSCSIQLDLSGHTELDSLEITYVPMPITSDTELQ